MRVSTADARWTSFVALGDSFTEGLMDDLRADGRHAGWADRVAAELAVASAPEPFRYANLAVRGRLLADVVDEQVPTALQLGPDLVSLGAGVNDALRPSFDVDRLATALENGTQALRRQGADVVLFAFGDPGRRSRVMGRIRGRIRTLNTAVHAIAQQYGCMVVDFWGVAIYDDDRLWDADRLHLSPAGHALAARTVLSTLGRGTNSWRTPPAAEAPMGPLSRLGSHAAWVREHAGPWAVRRLRGESSGDEVTPKDPQWRVIEPAVHRSGVEPSH